jgi:uncharacterized membrane protein YraQ (UPF0718 family)
VIPTGPDLMALVIKVGEFLLDIGPFILFGAVLASAQVTLFRSPRGPWTGQNLIAAVAALPLGLVSVFAAAARAPLWGMTVPETTEPARREGTLRRAGGYVDSLILPFFVSAIAGAIIVVLTPTEPLWTLLSPGSPWRIALAPLAVGLFRPRAGTELPLVMALITKGLDPAGAAAAIAGAGYLHPRGMPGKVAHLGLGIAVGLLAWALGMTSW